MQRNRSKHCSYIFQHDHLVGWELKHHHCYAVGRTMNLVYVYVMSAALTSSCYCCSGHSQTSTDSKSPLSHITHYTCLTISSNKKDIRLVCNAPIPVRLVIKQLLCCFLLYTNCSYRLSFRGNSTHLIH